MHVSRGMAARVGKVRTEPLAQGEAARRQRRLGQLRPVVGEKPQGKPAGVRPIARTATHRPPAPGPASRGVCAGRRASSGQARRTSTPCLNACCHRRSSEVLPARRPIGGAHQPIRGGRRSDVQGRTPAGRKSTPSGVRRYPGTEPGMPVWPYCQTMRSVRGSMTITRSFASSLSRTSPFGNCIAKDG